MNRVTVLAETAYNASVLLRANSAASSQVTPERRVNSAFRADVSEYHRIQPGGPHNGGDNCCMSARSCNGHLLIVMSLRPMRANIAASSQMILEMRINTALMADAGDHTASGLATLSMRAPVTA